MANANASCLCGHVKIETVVDNKSYHACHCSICRRISGGPMMAVHVGSQIKISHQNSISSYSSSDWMERGFCSNCGTHLYVKMKQASDYYVPVWLFEDSDKFDFNLQIFIDDKPNSYCFKDSTLEMTGAEVFEKFSQS